MTWTWIAVVVGSVSVLIVGVALLVGRLLHDLNMDQPIVSTDVERRSRLRHWDEQIRADLDRARKGKPS